MVYSQIFEQLPAWRLKVALECVRCCRRPNPRLPAWWRLPKTTATWGSSQPWPLPDWKSWDSCRQPRSASSGGERQTPRPRLSRTCTQNRRTCWMGCWQVWEKSKRGSSAGFRSEPRPRRVATATVPSRHWQSTFSWCASWTSWSEIETQRLTLSRAIIFPTLASPQNLSLHSKSVFQSILSDCSTPKQTVASRFFTNYVINFTIFRACPVLTVYFNWFFVFFLLRPVRPNWAWKIWPKSSKFGQKFANLGQNYCNRHIISLFCEKTAILINASHDKIKEDTCQRDWNETLPNWIETF